MEGATPLRPTAPSPRCPCTDAAALPPYCAPAACCAPIAPLFPPQALHHTRIEGALRINARKGATTLRTLNNHPIPLVQGNMIVPIGGEARRVTTLQRQGHNRILVEHQRRNIRQVSGDRHKHEGG